MRIAVLGAAGQVGSALVRRLGGSADVVALDRAGADLSIPGHVAEAIIRARPEVVINAAAYTAVDRAESEPEVAQRINAEAVAEMAVASAKIGARLIHFSTDYVFDGTKPGPYVAHDVPNPQSAYGRSKLAGERALAASGSHDWLVLRVAWVYAPAGRNFMLTMLRLAREGKPLRVVADQLGTPMPAEWIAQSTICLLGAGAQGVHHLSPTGTTSWHGFACAIMDEAARRGILPSAPAVAAITTAEFPTPARRPAQSALADSLGDLVPGPRPSWRALLSQALAQVQLAA